MKMLEELLRASAERHQHLCPRQVLGVRMGLLGGRWLGIPVPQHDKRLLAIVETDGCAADAISVATGCWIGRRTMRVIDFGKVAATFVDTQTRRSVRIAPKAGVREHALTFARGAETRWQSQLLGYQRMSDDELLDAQEVTLAFPLETLLGKDGYRVNCQLCGEEILNRREIFKNGLTMCGTCAGQGYYLLPHRTRDQKERNRPEPAPLFAISAKLI